MMLLPERCDGHLISAGAARAEQILDRAEERARHALAPPFGDNIEIAHLGGPTEFNTEFERDRRDTNARIRLLRQEQAAGINRRHFGGAAPDHIGSSVEALLQEKLDE